MTTKTALKATIADDLARPDLTTQIGAAIDEAIEHYKTERFYFNESRSATFATVAGTSRYTASDDGDIALFLEMDGFFIDDGTQMYDLGEPSDAAQLEYLLFNNTGQSRPYRYARLDDTIILYPIPDAVYTARPVGHIEVAGPVTDEEADNPWMTEAYELIRCRAKKYLFAHVIKNLEDAAVMGEAEQQALAQLRSKTSRKKTTGRIIPTQF